MAAVNDRHRTNYTGLKKKMYANVEQNTHAHPEFALKNKSKKPYIINLSILYNSGHVIYF